MENEEATIDKPESAGIFDSIPAEYGAESPAPKPEVPAEEEKPEAEIENSSTSKEREGNRETDAAPVSGESGGGESPDDNKEEDPAAEKTPKQFAQERRERKQKQRELLANAEKFQEENQSLKEQREQAQARLAELEEKIKTGSATEDHPEIEQYRTRAEQAEQRYIQAANASFDPYQDEDVKRYETQVEDALRANIPKRARGEGGERLWLNFEQSRKDPDRKHAMDLAVQSYAVAANEGNADELDKAVAMFGAAIGNLDMEDDDLRESLDGALLAASDPFTKGVKRFQEVVSNADKIAAQKRAESIRSMESQLLAPLRLPSDQVDKALSEDPSNGWANFAKLIETIPEDIRMELEEEVKTVSGVLAAMDYQGLPLPPNATSEQIEQHYQHAQAAQDQALESALYSTAGRLLIDGGLLPHFRAVVEGAEKRIDEHSESTSIPNRGDGGPGNNAKSPGIFADISSNY